MSSDKHLRCSFLWKVQGNRQRSSSPVPPSISAMSVFSLCNEILAEEEDRESSEPAVPSPVPQEIKEVLDQYVIGQEGAKRALAVAVYNHYKRVNNQGGLDEGEIDKANILLIGADGSRQDAARADAGPDPPCFRSLLPTPPRSPRLGTVGEDVEKHPCSLAPGRRFQRGRVRTRKSSTSTKWTRSPGNPKNPSITRGRLGRGSPTGAPQDPRRAGRIGPAPGGSETSANRSTSNSTPAISCSFAEGLSTAWSRLIESRLGRRRIGFGEKASEEERDELLPYVEPEDLQRFRPHPRTRWTSPGRGPLDRPGRRLAGEEPGGAEKTRWSKQYRKMFELEGIGLTFDKEALRTIAKKDTGPWNRRAGACVSVIEDVMRDVMFEMPSRTDVREVVVYRRLYRQGCATAAGTPPGGAKERSLSQPLPHSRFPGVGCAQPGSNSPESGRHAAPLHFFNSLRSRMATLIRVDQAYEIPDQFPVVALRGPGVLPLHGPAPSDWPTAVARRAGGG